MYVVGNGLTGAVTQMFVDRERQVFVRRLISGAWNSWIQLARQDLLPNIASNISIVNIYHDYNIGYMTADLDDGNILYKMTSCWHTCVVVSNYTVFMFSLYRHGNGNYDLLNSGQVENIYNRYNDNTNTVSLYKNDVNHTILKIQIARIERYSYIALLVL